MKEGRAGLAAEAGPTLIEFTDGVGDDLRSTGLTAKRLANLVGRSGRTAEDWLAKRHCPGALDLLVLAARLAELGHTGLQRRVLATQRLEAAADHRRLARALAELPRLIGAVLDRAIDERTPGGTAPEAAGSALVESTSDPTARGGHHAGEPTADRDRTIG